MSDQMRLDVSVDEDVWSSYPIWTPVEITHLVVDLDPDKLEGNFDYSYDAETRSRMSKVQRILDRWREHDEFKKGIKPLAAVSLLEEHGHPLPARLANAVARKSNVRLPSEITNEDVAEEDGGESVSALKNERRSLRLLLLAMAVEAYEFKPTANRDKAASKISALTAVAGIKVGRQTVSKHLNRALQALDEDHDVNLARYVREGRHRKLPQSEFD